MIKTDIPIPAPPPDPPSFRSALYAIALVAGVAELAYMMMNFSAMPVFLKYSVGYGETMVASIGTAFLLCEGLMKGPFGILGDRVGRKWLMIIGPMVSVFTSLCTLVVQPQQWYLFVALRILDGLGAAALWPSALTMMADVVAEDRRSQAMSLFNVTYLVGVALGPLIGGAANDLTRLIAPRVDPYHASFYVTAFLFALTAFFAWWRVPDIRPHHETHQTGLEAGFHFADLIHSLKQIPTTLLTAFVTFLGIGLCMQIIKLFALDEFKIGETQYGALLVVPALVVAGASVPLGTIGDRMGKARAVRLGMGVCAFSMWALILIKSQVALIIGGSLIGIGFVIAFPAWMALISASCDPGQRGAVMGAVGTVQGLGAMIGAPTGGYLYEHAHLRVPLLPWLNAHYTPFIGCALLLLIAWTLCLTIIQEKAVRC